MSHGMAECLQCTTEGTIIICLSSFHLIAYMAGLKDCVTHIHAHTHSHDPLTPQLQICQNQRSGITNCDREKCQMVVCSDAVSYGRGIIERQQEKILF